MQTKKPFHILTTEPKTSLISKLERVPSNRIPTISKKDSSNVHLLTNINHRKTFSDGNDLISSTSLSSKEKERKKNFYLLSIKI